jgi:hypothetical protein
MTLRWEATEGRPPLTPKKGRNSVTRPVNIGFEALQKALQRALQSMKMALQSWSAVSGRERGKIAMRNT